MGNEDGETGDRETRTGYEKRRTGDEGVSTPDTVFMLNELEASPVSCNVVHRIKKRSDGLRLML